MSFSLKRVLCALDLGPVSPRVIWWAGEFAGQFGSSIELFHAQWLDVPPYFTSSQVEDLSAQMRRHQEILREKLKQLGAEWLPSAVERSATVVEGHAVEAIRRRMTEKPVELVVLGSHGRSGVARLLLGSVSENIVRHSISPVLVVHPSESQAVRRLLCPVNFSPLSLQTLAAAAEVGARFEAEVIALHVVERGDQSEEEMRQRICDWVPDSLGRRCPVLEVTRRGNAGEEVVRFAGEREVDLVVIGAESRPFAETTILGTTSIRVIRHSPCPVLVIPRAT